MKRRNGENGGEAGNDGNGSDSSSLLVLFVAAYIYRPVVEKRKKQVMKKENDD